MNFKDIKPINHQMDYRRFGKTNKNVSVITLGGMRFRKVWEDPKDEIPQETIDDCKLAVEQAFEHGINLIETAYGYKKSEKTFGIVLNDILNIPRDKYFLMTKGHAESGQEMRKMVEEQLKLLKTDYIDFYAWHGINNEEILLNACSENGPILELIKMKNEGIIGHIGFSTHAPLEVIIKAIETDLFDFVNLHYYYFFQRNKAAVDLAETKDMGVFIISPNDKGGQLFNPPPKLVELTAPLHPIQWNAKFCLSNPAIHTLTFGFPKTSRFDLLDGIIPANIPLNKEEALIKHKMDDQKLLDPYAEFEGHNFTNDPSGLNIPEILRFRKLWKCYDMKNFGIYRYNMFNEKGHWFPGAFPNDENLSKIDLTNTPKNIPLIDLIKETHQALYQPKE